MRKLIHSLILLATLGMTPAPLLSQGKELAPQRPQKAPWFPHKKAENFNELKHIIMELIGRAESRIILYTDFLSDGEISSGLFLAQYRKVQTVVFLGETAMNRYLSRLGYLKAQNIPVFVRPAARSQFREPTVILVDRQLYRINRDLDVLKPQLGAEIQLANPEWVSRFEAELVAVLKNNKQAIPTPLPQVGRAGRGGSGMQKMPSHYQGEQDGSYNYDRVRANHRPAPGVPTKLPKTPVYEQRRRQVESQRKAPADATRQVGQSRAGSSPSGEFDKSSNQGQAAGEAIILDPGLGPSLEEDRSSSSEEWFDVD